MCKIKNLQDVYEWLSDKLECNDDDIYNDNIPKIYTSDQNIIESIIKNFNSGKLNKNDIFLLLTVIDSCYSTQVRRFGNLLNTNNVIYENIQDENVFDIDNDELKEIIDKICCDLIENKENNFFPFSLITKFFSLLRYYGCTEETKKYFPIYDKYVNYYLRLRTDIPKFDISKIKGNDKEHIYTKFYESMKQLSDKGKLNFYRLDKKIWLAMKMTQSLVKNNKSADNLKEEAQKSENGRYIEFCVKSVRNNDKS
ncbi:MAG: hypothetical protein MJ180_01620 [Candidatus Gastranaerophilales bacterium]|nr:hypothetical protein [Candidatus Gastranaerophilales bacterium]